MKRNIKKIAVFLAILTIFISVTSNFVLAEDYKSDSNLVSLEFSSDTSKPIKDSFSLDLSKINDLEELGEKEEKRNQQRGYFVQIFRPGVISLDKELLKEYKIIDIGNQRIFSEEKQTYFIELSENNVLKNLPLIINDQITIKDGIFIKASFSDKIFKFSTDPSDFEIKDTLLHEETDQKIISEKDSEIVIDNNLNSLIDESLVNIAEKQVDENEHFPPRNLRLSTPNSTMQAQSSGLTNPLVTPTIIDPDDIAPANYLQIIDGIAGSRVEVLKRGGGLVKEQRLSAQAPEDDGALWMGNWEVASKRIFKKMHGNSGAYAFSFKPSNPTWNHNRDPKAGWGSSDLELDTTSMWVQVKYTNAAIYKGEVVDAIAMIKITPMKNRNPNVTNKEQAKDYGHSPYHPMIQISDSLYHGWCWQNVEKININLEFYKKSGDKISFPSGNFKSEDAVYYTINSLNEANVQWDGAALGPEYVLPEKGTVSNAYVIPNSNIVTEYNGGWGTGIQYAYNGGTNEWKGDNPTHPEWSKNSVMFTTEEIDYLNFTLGNLERDPITQQVKRTNFVWASISTQSFTGQKVEYIDLPVSKVWDHGDIDFDKITVRLYKSYCKDGIEQKEEYRVLNILKSDNWKGLFHRIPNLLSLQKLIEKAHPSSEITDVKYLIKEDPIDGYVTEINELKIGVEIKNSRKPKIKIVKTDENQNALEGAKFLLFDIEKDSNEIIETSNGELVTKPLDIGKTYELKEDKAPSGYILKDTIWKIYVKNPTTMVITEKNIGELDQVKTLTTVNSIVNLNIKNQPNRIVFKKTDEQEEPITGAIFGLYKKINGEYTTVIDNGQHLKVTSDKDGELVFKKLAPGEYALKEESAPQGFVALEGWVKEFKVLADGKIVKIDNAELDEEFLTIKNKLVLLDMTLRKEDAFDSSVSLSGAIFDLYVDQVSDNTSFTKTVNYNGKTYYLIRESLKTDSEGLVQIDKLPILNNPTYLIIETKAPKDYSLGDIKIPFYFDDNHKLVLINDNNDIYGVNHNGQLAIKNYKVYNLPQTGSIGTFLFTFMGSLIISILMYLAKKKKCLWVRK